MDIFNISKYNVEELCDKSQQNISGGVAWWVPFALAIAYDEINDIWGSGGDNLRKAYKSGQEWARSV